MRATSISYILAYTACLLLVVERDAKAANLVPTAKPTPRPTDKTVGTAFAPTTPGGACLNSEDYSKWTTEQTLPDGTVVASGFDYLPIQSQKCAEICVTTAVSAGGDTDYDCSFLQFSGKPRCPENLFEICVSECMSGNTTHKPFPAMIAYSEPCASCFGKIAYCARKNCTTSCAQGGSSSTGCRLCNEDKCNPDFMICSGLDPTLKPEKKTNLIGVAIGAVCGGLALLIMTLLLGYFHRMKTKQNRMLSPEELAKIAQTQSMAAITTSQAVSVGGNSGSGGNSPLIGGGVMSMSSQSTNPTYKLSPSSSPAVGAPGQTPSVDQFSGLTPYQQQYLAQQQALAASGIDLTQQPHVPPSVRASRMVSTAMTSGLPQSLIASARPLVVMYDFVGESNDELTCKVGDKILGIEQQDGWWLAQDKNGVIGLISASYCTLDTSAPMPGSSSRVEPSF